MKFRMSAASMLLCSLLIIEVGLVPICEAGLFGGNSEESATKVDQSSPPVTSVSGGDIRGRGLFYPAPRRNGGVRALLKTLLSMLVDRGIERVLNALAPYIGNAPEKMYASPNGMDSDSLFGLMSRFLS